MPPFVIMGVCGGIRTLGEIELVICGSLRTRCLCFTYTPVFTGSLVPLDSANEVVEVIPTPPLHSSRVQVNPLTLLPASARPIPPL